MLLCDFTGTRAASGGLLPRAAQIRMAASPRCCPIRMHRNSAFIVCASEPAAIFAAEVSKVFIPLWMSPFGFAARTNTTMFPCSLPRTVTLPTEEVSPRMIALGENQYGKSRVRVMKVERREGSRHEVYEWNVAVWLKGD